MVNASGGNIIESHIVKSGVSKSLRLINCLLVFCMSSAILTTCVVIHLGIENYNRLHECRELREEVALLKWRLKVDSNISSVQTQQRDQFAKEARATVGEKDSQIVVESQETVYPPTLPTMRFTDVDVTVELEEETADVGNDTLYDDKGTEETLNYRNDEPVALFDNELTLQTVNSRIRECMARIKLIEDVQLEYENSRDFFQQQMHQRLVAMKNLLLSDGEAKETKPAFSAFLSKDVLVESYVYNGDYGTTMRFDRVPLNEGFGFDETLGVFRCPLEGVYAFHLDVAIARDKYDKDSRRAVYGGVSPVFVGCTAELRKNGQTMIRSMARRGDETSTSCSGPLGLTLVARLVEGDEVTTALVGSCRIEGEDSSMRAIFQGYYLHG